MPTVSSVLRNITHVHLDPSGGVGKELNWWPPAFSASSSLFLEWPAWGPGCEAESLVLWCDPLPHHQVGAAGAAGVTAGNSGRYKPSPNFA